jgi:hypothetical protein
MPAAPSRRPARRSASRVPPRPCGSFDADIRRVGRETVAAIEAREPGVAIERRIVAPREIAGETREPDGPRRGTVVAVLNWLSRSGAMQVVGISLGWDGWVTANPLPCA